MGIGNRDVAGGLRSNVVIKVSFGKRPAAENPVDAPAKDVDELDMDDLPDIDTRSTEPFEGFELEAEPPVDVPGRVAFGVELPAGRNDMVASIAALTQLMSIADEQGVDADSSLRMAIGTLRHTLEGASVILPPHLLELLDMIAPLEPATIEHVETPVSLEGPHLRLVD